MKPIDRVLSDLEDNTLADKLAAMPGADLTTLLLEVVRRRATVTTPADVMRQRERDRFVSPGDIDLAALHDTESVLLNALPSDVETVVLAPVTPMGMHSSVAAVSRDRVVSTVRRTDVAADPTTGLAIEAAVRRRKVLDQNLRSAGRVRLASLQRVVRAQMVSGPMSFSHFTLLGLVTAGRDSGSHQFEREALARHAVTLSTCILATGADHLTVSISDWTGGELASVPEAVAESLSRDSVTVVETPDRERARGYYLHGAFEIDVRFGETTFSAADGGLVDWTQSLLANRKERLMISGVGVDRIALSRPSARNGQSGAVQKASSP